MADDILDDLKMVIDISSRVDERVKMMQNCQQEMKVQLGEVAEDISSLMTRVTILEAKNGGKVHEIEQNVDLIDRRLLKMEQILDKFDLVDRKVAAIDLRVIRIEDKQGNWKDGFQYWGDLFFRGLWVIVVCYLLYKFGLNSPPIP